ncbi:hypothetical protein WJX82_005323 [Trebouxia sp. C0006]
MCTFVHVQGEDGLQPPSDATQYACAWQAFCKWESHTCEEDGPWNARSSTPCRSAKLPQATSHGASFGHALRLEGQQAARQ